MNNKAISETIGVILMIVITVAIATTTYIYVSGMIENAPDYNKKIKEIGENMTEEEIYKEYEKYLKQMWKISEEFALTLGITSNQTIGIFFDKLTQPFVYWKKDYITPP